MSAQSPEIVEKNLKLLMSCMFHIGVGGEMVCGGMTLRKVSGDTFKLEVEINPENLADILEGEELVRFDL
jgi:hypothetical protein